MLDIILHEMEGLSLGEKRELIDATKAAVARELGRMAGDAAPEACPWCGSSSFIRKGRNRDGSQRWLCRECGRTFPAKSRGLLAASKLDAATCEPCQYNGQWDPRFYAASIASGSYARALSKRSKNSCMASAGTRSPMDSCGR